VTLQIALTIPEHGEQEVARQCLALASQQDWKQLVRFAVAIVALAESVDSRSEVQAVFLPAEAVAKLR
jgi:hypothetical protein